MSSDVIDNRHVRLAGRVRDLLDAGAVGARFAVGYLFLDGLTSLRAQLARLDEAQFLIGNVVNHSTEEQVREEARLRTGDAGPGYEQEDFASGLRETHTRVAAVTALNLRRTIDEMPRSAEGQSLLLTLAARIAAGALKVRLYTPGRIHAKVTLLRYPGGRQIAVVGSSNLTLGGPAHPTEMNVFVRDAASVAELDDWYRRLWDAAQDFHKELFDEIGQCWATRPLPASEAGAGR